MSYKYWLRQSLKTFQNFLRISKLGPCLIFLIFTGLCLTYVNVRLLQKTIADVKLQQCNARGSLKDDHVEKCHLKERNSSAKIAWIFGQAVRSRV